MAPSQSNYLNLQITFFTGSCLIILLYGGLFFGQLLGPGQLLGTSPLNLMIAGLHVGYFLLLRPVASRRSEQLATAIDMLLLSVNVAILLLATGGFSSPYFVFWLLIVMLSSALGWRVMAAYASLSVLYLAASAFLGTAAPEDLIYVVASAVAGILGLWLWRNHPVDQTSHRVANELTQKLKLEQVKSDILLRSIGDGVLVVDQSGTIQLFNPPAAAITGWGEDEACGLAQESVLPLEDEDTRSLRGEDNPFHSVLAAQQHIRRGDLLIQNRRQQKLHISLVVSPIFGENGSVNGAVAIFRDISAETAAARQRDEFISTASHEMRTPVAAIEGFLALSLNPKVSTIDENAQKYIQKAHDSTRHLGKLFQDLLSVTKLEDGRLANHPEPFELGKIIKTSIDELVFKAERKNLDLKLKTSHETGGSDRGGILPLFYVNADPERIREVFINLVDNAIKFTPEGSVNVSIGGDDRVVTIGVHDQGIGIPPGEVSHLFQKFYRVDNSKTREIGGTGLGLYLCRTIIELYNGRIWIESQEGKGSNFYFSLPRLSYSQAQQLRAKLEKQVIPTIATTPSAAKTVASATTNP